MKRVFVASAYLGAVLLLAGVMVGGFYLRSLQRPALVGQADASASPTDASPDSPSPSAIPSPSPSASPSPIAPSPTGNPGVPAGLPKSAPTPACSPQVITSFTAKAAPQSVILSWKVSGGCGNETGYIQGQFGTESTGMTMYPGYWVIQIQRPRTTYTDHPHKPATAGSQCLFALTYYMVLNGIGPNNRPPAQVTAEVYNVNLC